MTELLFPLQFKRQYSGPLDPDLVFATTAALNAYLTNPLRYAGMQVTCLEEEGKSFILNNARDAWIAVVGSGGGSSAGNIDGGSASSVYLVDQSIDGGGA